MNNSQDVNKIIQLAQAAGDHETVLGLSLMERISENYCALAEESSNLSISSNGMNQDEVVSLFTCAELSESLIRDFDALIGLKSMEAIKSRLEHSRAFVREQLSMLHTVIEALGHDD